MTEGELKALRIKAKVFDHLFAEHVTLRGRDCTLEDDTDYSKDFYSVSETVTALYIRFEKEANDTRNRL